MEDDIRVLIVEDEILDYELVVRELKKNFANITTFRAAEANTYLGLLSSSEINVIISDFNVPGFGALEALRILKKEKLDIPFIIVSGALGDEKAAETIKQGAFDLIMKNNLTRLSPTVRLALYVANTRKKESERIKRANESSSMREQAMAVVSHDIKSPLNSIQLSLEIIQRNLSDPYSEERDQSISNYLMKIDRSVLRIKSMIADYIDQLNIDAGLFHIERVLSRADLMYRELEEVFLPIAEKKQIHLSMEPVEQEVFGVFDYARLFQALMNVIGNAIKFTPAGGTVLVRFEIYDDKLNFIVQDTGPGIPEEFQRRIFDKFWREERSQEKNSAGLGLFITKAIIEEHNGQIDVVSDVGQGTKFIITIPQGDIDSETGLTAFAKSKDETKQACILLIEDDEDLNDLLTELLRKEGYEVKSFFNGRAGYEAFLYKDINPDIIVLDYQLPGMRGEEIAIAIRSLPGEKRQVPLIISSAEINIERMQNEKEKIFTLKKPLVFSELTRTIKRILDNE